jgi:predicted RNA-binding protein
MSTQESIYNQHHENTEWLNKLSFYTDEVKIMTGRLEEIAAKNNTSEVLAHVEHFQNQLIIQKNNIDEIRHAVKQNENQLEAEIKSNPVAVDHRSMEYHSAEKDLVESFENIFNSLRDEFNEFSSKWM